MKVYKMPDIALHFNNTVKEFDISIAGGDLASCDSLETAVIVSLFTWARADINEVEPNATRFGWWGDKVDEDSPDSTGSKLYLLKRCKITDKTISQAEEYIRDALKWMIDDGVASQISIKIERNQNDKNRLDAVVKIIRGETSNTLKFNDLWSML